MRVAQHNLSAHPDQLIGKNILWGTSIMEKNGAARLGCNHDRDAHQVCEKAGQGITLISGIIPPSLEQRERLFEGTMIF